MLRIREAFAATAFSLVLAAAPGHAQTIDPSLWTTDGDVHAVAQDAGTIYIGGLFSNVGPYTGNAAPVDATSGAPLASFPKVNGQVFAVIPDGAGGWYLGGEFTTVGGQTRNRIAHVASDLSVSGWNPNANGTIRALALRGSTVYAGGYFTNIGGQSRNYLAALDVATGAASSWNPNPNSSVYALAVNTYSFSCPEGTCFVTNVYVGGDFGTIGGQSRAYLAAIDATTGAASSWNPNANDRVITVQAAGNSSVSLRIYAGGFFGVIGGQPRNYIAALNAAGNATTWNPNANNLVQTLAVSGGTVYAGGSFTSIGGQARNYIAALNNTGAATTWNPNANLSIQTLAVSGSTVYAGGDFNSIGGQYRNYIAALDAATAVATSWNPNANSLIRSLAVSGSTVYAGGLFTSIGRLARNNIAALDATTGAATTWDPNASSPVLALALNGSTVYAGGSFNNIGGQPRNRIAALDVATGAATTWNPSAIGNPSAYVYALEVSDSTVYAGGSFTNIGGQLRNNIAALDATTGTAMAWNPNADGIVRALAPTGSTVYAGGFFTNIGGQMRPYIAALDAATGAATAWDPQSNGTVLTLALNGSTVYAGGYFDAIGGDYRNRIAALDVATGAATAWRPDANGSVLAIAVNGSKVYAGGSFTNIGGWAAANFAELSTATGLASIAALDGSPWIGTNNVVHSIAANVTKIYAGGDFTTVGSGLIAQHIAAVEVDYSLACDAIAPSASWGACGTTVGTTPTPMFGLPLVLDDAGGVYVGLNDVSQTGVRVKWLAASGSLASGWPPNGVLVAADSNSSYPSLAPDGSGGVFVVWRGLRDGALQSSVYCQRLTQSGVPASGWPVGGVAVPGSAFLATSDGSGGVFITGGTEENKIFRLDGNGAVPAGWPVDGLALSSGPILAIVADEAGGAFVGFAYERVAHIAANASIVWQKVINTTYIDFLVRDAFGGVFVVGDYFVQHLASDGSIAPGWPTASVTLESYASSACTDGAGGLLVCWVNNSIAGWQRFTPFGTVATGWPAGGFRIGPMGQNQAAPGVAPDGTGGAYLMWHEDALTTTRNFWGVRVCPTGSVAPGWPADGALVCADVRYTLSGGPGTSMLSDGAGGAFAGLYRRTAANFAGTLHVQRLGSEPPSPIMTMVSSGSPSTAVVGNVTVTFDAVTSSGELLLDLTAEPSPPAGLRTVPATPPAVYELSTTASFTGGIDVCIDYDPATVGGDESALKLLHYESASGPPTWVDVTTSVDVDANRICGRTTSLSPFAVVEYDPTDANIPGAVLRLHQNQPNPFNPTTTIAYEVPERGWVRLAVFDVRGRLVHTLADGIESAGPHRVVWSGDDRHGHRVGSGVYFYRLETGKQSLRRRMVLVR